MISSFDRNQFLVNSYTKLELFLK